MVGVAFVEMRVCTARVRVGPGLGLTALMHRISSETLPVLDNVPPELTQVSLERLLQSNSRCPCPCPTDRLGVTGTASGLITILVRNDYEACTRSRSISTHHVCTQVTQKALLITTGADSGRLQVLHVWLHVSKVLVRVLPPRLRLSCTWPNNPLCRRDIPLRLPGATSKPSLFCRPIPSHHPRTCVLW